MPELYYIGLDVHKKSISFCIKTGDGTIVQRGQVAATRAALTAWASALERPWVGALEATLFTGWIYDHLQPFAQELQVAHPAMLKAIACAKKKNDRLDATKISDLLRCNLLLRCYVAPPALRELRRVLRYRNLLVGEAVRMKNKISGLLMEVGEPYDARRLHGRNYFYSYLDSLRDTPESGDRAARHHPRQPGNVRSFAAGVTARIAAPSAVAGTRRVAAVDSRRGGGDGVDLGAGDRRARALRFAVPGGELLWVVFGTARVGRQDAAGTAVEAAQQAFAAGADRGGETRAALEPATARRP